MTYDEAINYIHSLNQFGIKPGLERITALLDKLGNPQKDISVIHIAGTNGKGSTSTALSNIMIESGKKTGLFISPYVIDFRERIQINGEYISKEDLVRLTQRVAELVPLAEKEVGDKITEFEFITALMFDYFKEQNCDIAVLEVGLGGRLDSTNVVEKPLISVITRIDLDHIAILGDTLEKIAYEKSGIIKNGCPVITSSAQSGEALNVIKNVAEQNNSHFILADLSEATNINLAPYGSTFNLGDTEIAVSLPGKHQIENMTTVVKAAEYLGIEKEYIIKGIAKTKFPARLEVISKTPLVILDGAHNANGADVLADYLDEHKIKPITIFGVMKDKDCTAVIEKIATRSSAVYTLKVLGNPRAESAETLAQIAGKYCIESKPMEDYEQALKAAGKKSEELNLPILICGSLYLASDIRQSAINNLKK